MQWCPRRTLKFGLRNSTGSPVSSHASSCHQLFCHTPAAVKLPHVFGSNKLIASYYHKILYVIHASILNTGRRTLGNKALACKSKELARWRYDIFGLVAHCLSQQTFSRARLTRVAQGYSRSMHISSEQMRL